VPNSSRRNSAARSPAGSARHWWPSSVRDLGASDSTGGPRRIVLQSSSRLHQLVNLHSELRALSPTPGNPAPQPRRLRSSRKETAIAAASASTGRWVGGTSSVGSVIRSIPWVGTSSRGASRMAVSRAPSTQLSVSFGFSRGAAKREVSVYRALLKAAWLPQRCPTSDEDRERSPVASGRLVSCASGTSLTCAPPPPPVPAPKPGEHVARRAPAYA
jgi:hypothetical protein